MRVVRWYLGLLPLGRCVLGGVLLLALVGGCYGLTEAVTRYPVGSWFGVTLYVAMLGSLAGLVLGLLTGTLWSLASRVSRRLIARSPAVARRTPGP